MKIYGGSIKPLTGPNEWPLINKDPPLPPVYKTRPGRPTSLRKKSAGELSKDGERLSRTHIPLTCSRCKKKGHNIRRCPEDPKVKEKMMNPKKRVRVRSKKTPTLAAPIPDEDVVRDTAPILHDTTLIQEQDDDVFLDNLVGTFEFDAFLVQFQTVGQSSTGENDQNGENELNGQNEQTVEEETEQIVEEPAPAKKKLKVTKTKKGVRVMLPQK